MSAMSVKSSIIVTVTEIDDTQWKDNGDLTHITMLIKARF